MTRSLLIVACSQRKAAGMTRGTAWDVYDGVVYRILKKRLGPRSDWPAWLDVLIVSAKYGVIRPGRRIDAYDQPMPVGGRPGRWAGRLRRLVAGRDYHFVHVNLGRAYQNALGDAAALFPKADVTIAAGGIGQRAAQLLAWVKARIESAVSAGMESRSCRSRQPRASTRPRSVP